MTLMSWKQEKQQLSTGELGTAISLYLTGQREVSVGWSSQGLLEYGPPEKTSCQRQRGALGMGEQQDYSRKHVGIFPESKTSYFTRC